MSERKQLVDEGRVWCAVRSKEVDVETCFCCDRLRGADLDAPRPTVTCDVDTVVDLLGAVGGAVGPISP